MVIVRISKKSCLLIWRLICDRLLLSYNLKVRHNKGKTMTEKRKREIISLRMSKSEYDQVDALLVKMTLTKNEPLTRADLLREAINQKAVEVTGQEIFTEKAAQ